MNAGVAHEPSCPGWRAAGVRHAGPDWCTGEVVVPLVFRHGAAAAAFNVAVMLRLLYADQGSKQDLLDAVRATRAWALARAPEGLSQVRGYLADGGPFPERLHLSTLFGRFYLDLFELLARWADHAEAEIAAWPHTAGLGMTDRARALLEEMQTRLQVLADHAAGQPPPGSGGT